ncbi:hypothetical protein GCL60_11900 [Silvanigrella paludirubra]|uniref:Uncharacterized protein n=1 Tax=Silvanigrella paludirubra TaxID=2499159 RepID=A0A6N6VUK7_9BACT|nr:C39 family peptidase [Silvanigrella paludirubra]KAB8037871.1 hypothetical protein GCL60_11900 [Silvanigrella paludirubra]
MNFKTILSMAAISLSFTMNAYSTYYEYKGEGKIIPNSDKYIGAQNDNWSCGAYSATKMLNIVGHGVSYNTIKNDYAQKVFSAFAGRFSNTVTDIGLTPDKLALTFNSYIAQKVAESIKYGGIKTKGYKAEVRINASINDIENEVRYKNRPVAVLVYAGSQLHWVTVIGWMNSNSSVIYAESDGTINYENKYEFDRKRVNNWNWAAAGILPNTIVKIEEVEFNKLDAFFDHLFLGTENAIYQIPVVGEIYNLHKLGAEKFNQIVNFGPRGANEVLKSIGLPGIVPDLTVPMTLEDVVKLKNQAKKVAEEAARVSQQAAQEAQRVRDQIAEEANRIKNQLNPRNWCCKWRR